MLTGEVSVVGIELRDCYYSKTKTSWHLWAEHKKLSYVKSLICTSIKCYRPNSIDLLSRI